MGGNLFRRSGANFTSDLEKDPWKRCAPSLLLDFGLFYVKMEGPEVPQYFQNLEVPPESKADMPRMAEGGCEKNLSVE